MPRRAAVGFALALGCFALARPAPVISSAQFAACVACLALSAARRALSLARSRRSLFSVRAALSLAGVVACPRLLWPVRLARPFASRLRVLFVAPLLANWISKRLAGLPGCVRLRFAQFVLLRGAVTL